MEPSAPAANNTPAPAPAQPAAPVPAPAPAPAPASPPVPPAPPAKPPTAEEAADAANDKEWDDAADELFPGLKGAKKEGDKNEPAKPKEGTEAEGAQGQTPKDQEPNAEQKPGDDTKPEGGGDEAGGDKSDDDALKAEADARAARASTREYQHQLDTVKNDVREQLFKDVPQTLVDGDGDPIRGIEDVMKLINPQTNEAFTEEQAGMWLLHAQQEFNKGVEQMNKQIDQIAEVNVEIKDQADNIRYKYGELLKTLPDPDKPNQLYRDTLWNDYQDTLVKDPNTNLIVRAPVSLERFYERALRPYLQAAQQPPVPAPAEGTEGQPPAADGTQPPAAEPPVDRSRNRQDRSDIYGGGNTDTLDEDDKEWADAATVVFGPRKA